METISIKVRRHDPSTGKAPVLKEYTVPYEEGMRILDALLYVYEEVDHSFACRYSCKVGNCKVCLVKANGKTMYSCQERVENGMVIEPMPEFAEVRDVVCDLHKRVKRPS